LECQEEYNNRSGAAPAAAADNNNSKKKSKLQVKAGRRFSAIYDITEEREKDI